MSRSPAPVTVKLKDNTMASKMSNELEFGVRRRPEYEKGKEAYERQLTSDDCPYRKGVRRLSWLSGWYDSRTNARLGHLFEKYATSYPDQS